MSKLNIKFSVDTTAGNKYDKVIIEKEDKKQRLLVNLAAGSIDPKNANNTKIDKATNAFKKKVVTTTGTSGPSADVNVTDLQPDAITSFSIVDKDEQEYVASKIRRAIYLKLAIKDKTGTEFGEVGTHQENGTAITTPFTAGTTAGTNAPLGTWTFVLNGIKNSQELFMDVNTLRLAMGRDLELSEKLIDLNDYTQTSFTNDNDDAPKVMWNFSKSLTALIELEKLLEELHENFGKRQVRYTTAAAKSEFLWYDSKLSDLDPEKIIEEAKKLELYALYGPIADKLDFTGRTKNTDGILDFATAGGGKQKEGPDPDKIKSVLYYLNDGRTSDVGQLYKFKIDSWLEYLLESYLWTAMAGFKNNHEILTIHRLGFEESNILVFKDKKFMGFPVLIGVDGQPLEIEKAPTGNTDTAAGEKGFRIKGTKGAAGAAETGSCSIDNFTNPNINYVAGGEINTTTGHFKKPENQIRGLRALEVKDGGGTGTNTAPFWDASGKSIFADNSKISRQDLFGFQPQDIELKDNAGTGDLDEDLTDANAESKGKKFGDHNLKDGDIWKMTKDTPNRLNENAHVMTRIKFKLLDTANLADAIKIAFTGGGSPTTDNLHNLEPEIPSHVDVAFNMAHTNKEAVLKDYYDYIKGRSVSYIGDTNMYIPKSVNVGGKVGNNGTQGAVDFLNSAYEEAKIWARIWGTDYDSENDQTKCENDQALLDKILNQGTPDTSKPGAIEASIRFKIKENPVWKKEVEDKKAKIKARITELKKPKTGTLDALIADASTGPVAKLIYEKAKAKGTGSDTPSDELTTLAGLIDKVKAGTASTSDLQELRKYKAATDATDKAKKEAWDLANEVKDSEIIDKSTNGAGADALQKMENALRKAKDDAKTAMNGEGGDADTGAYKKIGIEGMDDVAQINKIVEVFNKVKAAWDEKAYKDSFESTEIKALEDLRKANPTEWGKIDQYEKGGKKYASGAIDYLRSLKKKNQVTIQGLKTKPNGNEVMKEYKNVDGSAGVAKEDAERIAIYTEFKGSSDPEEKGLADLLEPDNDYEFKDTEEDIDKELDRIKDFIKKLREYKDAADTDPKGKVLKRAVEKITELSDAKNTLDHWINKLEARQKHLESKKQEYLKDDGKTPQESESFWTSVPAIIGYCLVGAAIVAGIAWWTLKGGSEGEEEGEE